MKQIGDLIVFENTTEALFIWRQGEEYPWLGVAHNKILSLLIVNETIIREKPMWQCLIMIKGSDMMLVHAEKKTVDKGQKVNETYW